MRKLIIPISFILLFILIQAFGNQEREQIYPQEEHEAVVRLALLDVIVTKDGEFLKNLTAEDFEIYEDGKKVSINSFELISFEDRVIEIEEEKEEEEKKTSPNRPKKKLTVIFDGINTWREELKEQSKNIIDELVPLVELGHEVMVLQLSQDKGLEVIQPYTTDPPPINVPPS